MSNFGETLAKHLYIEFRYGKGRNGDKMLFENSWKNKLWEEHGVMNNMDSYVDAVVDKVKKEFLKWNKTSTQVFTIPVTRDDFPFETFFDDIQMTVYATVIPDANNCKFGGSYASGKSGFYHDITSQYDGYKVCIPQLTLEGGYNAILERLRIVAAHELTHAYDDYSRRRTRKTKNGYKKSGDTLLQLGHKTGEFTASSFGEGDGDPNLKYKQEIGDLLYFTSKAETNAYVAQCIDELKPYIVGNNNSQDVMYAIKQTRIYREIQKMDESLKTMKILDGSNHKVYDEMKVDFLKTFNAIRSNPTKTFFAYKATPVNTFHQMVKIVSNKLERLKRRFYTQVSKQAYDLFRKYGDPGTDAGRRM